MPPLVVHFAAHCSPSSARMALGRPWCFVALVLALATDGSPAAASLTLGPTGRAPRRTRTRRRSSLGAWLALDLLGTLARVAECDDESIERVGLLSLLSVLFFNGTRIAFPPRQLHQPWRESDPSGFLDITRPCTRPRGAQSRVINERMTRMRRMGQRTIRASTGRATDCFVDRSGRTVSRS